MSRRSHALLEAWGQPRTYLLMVEVDEYFVLPTPTTSLDFVLRECTLHKAQVLRRSLSSSSRASRALIGPCVANCVTCP